VRYRTASFAFDGSYQLGLVLSYSLFGTGARSLLDAPFGPVGSRVRRLSMSAVGSTHWQFQRSRAGAANPRVLSGLRSALRRLGPATRIGVILLVLALPIVAGLTVALHGFTSPDVLTYLGAGERLNAGHPLYALGPGDRPIADPAWTGAPLLSPTLIAVAFRPIALLGEIGAGLWWLAMAMVLLGLLAWIVWRAPVRGGLVISLLMVPVVWQIAMGNVNALVMLLLALAWHWREDRRAGLLVAAAAALKVVPIVFVTWTGQRASLVIGAAVIAIVCLVWAGWANVLAYVGIASAAAPTDLSLAGALRSIGLSSVAGLAPYAVLLLGALAASRLPEHWGYVACVFATVFGSSAVGIHSIALLTLAIIPFVDPPPREPQSLAEDVRPDAVTVVAVRPGLRAGAPTGTV
jgi:hypothetical protein